MAAATVDVVVREGATTRVWVRFTGWTLLRQLAFERHCYIGRGAVDLVPAMETESLTFDTATRALERAELETTRLDIQWAHEATEWGDVRANDSQCNTTALSSRLASRADVSR